MVSSLPDGIQIKNQIYPVFPVWVMVMDTKISKHILEIRPVQIGANLHLQEGRESGLGFEINSHSHDTKGREFNSSTTGFPGLRA
jgi:hypothetical protein